MRKPIFRHLLCLIAIILFVSCSAAPPTDPTTGFEPHSAPKKPDNVSATNGYSDTIEITWDEVATATGYQIWAVPASRYGAATESTNRTESYSTLIQRGFKLIDVVTSETSYRLKGESENSSYVFSVVAMKVERSASSTSTLYSEPSDYVEGSTVGEIILSATASSDSLTLSWNISNLYSVLDNSRSPSSLYPHRISVMKKLSSSSEWDEIELADTEDEHTYSIPSSSLNIDTLYDFKIRMKVYSGETLINTVESSVYTITTDASFTPGRVENIDATSGKKRGEVTLSWRIPSLPEKDTIEPAFRVERTTDGSIWTTLTSDITNADGVYSITDNTLEDNTLYTYRIINGYRIGEREAVYQSEKDAETVSSVYSLWIPENITFDFKENDDNKGGTLRVNYDYNAPSAGGDARFYIGGKTWTENDFTPSDLEEKEGSLYTVSLESATPLTYYSFYFRFTFEGEEILLITNPGDVTVGITSSRDDLITDIKATDSRVREIKLSWTERASVLSSLGITDEDVTYSIYEGVEALECTINKDGDTRYVLIPSESGEKHTYRVKISAGGYFGVLEASGSALAVPGGLDAGDSTSAEEIKVTWTPNDKTDVVVYTLEYSADNEIWTELGYTVDGEASLPAAKDGTDGMQYYFRLKAVNREQGETSALYSEVETGSVFGAYGISPVVENNGLDPDCITIKWNAVKGAAYYIVSRNGSEIAQKIRNTTEFKDSADTIAALKTSSTPLSEEYTYTVTPYLDDATPAVITDATGATATGKLFAPPKNVVASKGVTQDSITVTWDSVPEADGYKIEKYSVTMKNGVSSYPSLKETVYTTDPFYTEGNVSLASSAFVQYIISSVKTGSDGKIESRKQTGSDKVKNSLGYEEESNIGYGLWAPSALTISSVTNETTGYYEPYTTVTWSFVPGATSYVLSSSVGSVTVNVADFKYPETGTVDNGKNPDEAGYLGYNADTGLYTYNDNNGLLTSVVINKYSVKACNGAAANEKTNATTVYRQPTEEDWVNIIMTILKPAFLAADSYFGGDWWIPDSAISSKTEDSYTYSSTGMTFNLYSKMWGGTYYNDKNYLSIAEYTDAGEELTIATTANIQFDYTNGGEAGYLGTDPLKLIGYNGNGEISITPLDTKIKSATVAFRNIYVRSVDGGGSYTVTISGSGSKTVADDKKFTRVL